MPEIEAFNQYSDGGKPGGGTVSARWRHDQNSPLFIRWQDGPIAEAGENGVQVDDVIEAAAQRLRFLNQGPYACRENSLAITKLEEALHWLEARTSNRQDRHVEGTSAP